MSMQGLKITGSDLHLWFAFVDDIREPVVLDRYLSWLNPEEAKQQKRFYFEKDRHQYLITRACIRVLLSRYFLGETGENMSPAAWRFVKNEYGRPNVDPQMGAFSPRFNISHSKGVVMLGFTRAAELGVDVECVTRDGDMVKLADRFFSPIEVQELHSLPVDRQQDRFFDYWTLKESYIKARGMGLSIPLDHFSFIPRPGKKIDIRIDPKQNDHPDRWQFKQWRLGPEHKAAVTLERGADNRFSVTMTSFVPAISDKPFQAEILHDSFD